MVGVVNVLLVSVCVDVKSTNVLVFAGNVWVYVELFVVDLNVFPNTGRRIQ